MKVESREAGRDRPIGDSLETKNYIEEISTRST